MKWLRYPAALLMLAWAPALAGGTGQQSVMGYYTMVPQPNCPIGPCFVQYAGPIAPSVAGSAATSVVAKASAGVLVDAYAICTATCYLLIYNATADPGNGATTAGTAPGNLQDCIGPSTQPVINYLGNAYEAFSTGITLVVSSTACGTETQSGVGFIHARVQ